MPRGYAGKWLDIDLSKEKIEETTFDEALLYSTSEGVALLLRCSGTGSGDDGHM